MSDNNCINLKMTLGAQYDVNIHKEEIIRDLFNDFLDNSFPILDDTVVPSTITRLRDYLFYNVNSLLEVNLSNITTLGAYVFSGCFLNSVDIPNLTTAGSGAFSDNSMASVVFPNLTVISEMLFQNCQDLVLADFSSVEQINEYAFLNCTNLEALYLRYNDGLVTLTDTSALANTKIANGTGYIYVPSDSIREYRSYGLWSEFSSQFLPIPNELENP